ncbi:hypothetical protein [Chlorobium sp. N1]|uniref:hypothetical protein n=1 Tax=Chlorobium sp. N1 TaxID=2491138 RepID=UPI0010397020|nr:hypothetical protein [Chlorobium sp. N1]TCD47005.1 hypothetical protein E0L29_10235 [Chlorobium sp. N1]
MLIKRGNGSYVQMSTRPLESRPEYWTECRGFGHGFSQQLHLDEQELLRRRGEFIVYESCRNRHCIDVIGKGAGFIDSTRAGVFRRFFEWADAKEDRKEGR